MSVNGEISNMSSLNTTGIRLGGATLPTSVPLPSFIITSYSYVWYCFNVLLIKVPGGHYVVDYIKKSINDDPYRTVIEISLVLYGIYYYLSKPQEKKSLRSNKPNLSEQEIELLIEEWTPEPLVNDSPVDMVKQGWRTTKTPVILDGGIQNHIKVSRDNDNEIYENVFNMATNNFLHLCNTSRVINKVKDVIKNYGVGACGPAGFYGNQDVHYNLKYTLSRFFGTESAILYGQDFCVAPSVLSAFTKRGDVIVADDQVSLSLQNALQLSRSTVYYYEHNNMDSLNQLLSELNAAEAREKLPALPRKFIVTEGLFHNSGDIAPLPDLVRLKLKHKYRLFIDETFSLGVLGAYGRGLPEHFGLNRADSIDVTVGSLATGLGSSGGFALGDHVMAYHQRIGSNAYCFSASLPAYTVAAASEVLDMMENDNSAVTQLHYLSEIIYDTMMNSYDALNQFIVIKSEKASPVLHLELNAQFRFDKFHYTKEDLFDTVSALQKKRSSHIVYDPYEQEETFLQSIVDEVLSKHNILITRNTFLIKHETLPIVPSLKISCNSDMDQEELRHAVENIRETIIKSCSSL